MWSRVFLLLWVVVYGVLVWCQLSTAASEASSNNVSSTLFPPMGNRLFLVPTHLIRIANFASVLQQIWLKFVYHCLHFMCWLKKQKQSLPRLVFLGAQLLWISCVDWSFREEDSAVLSMLLRVLIIKLPYGSFPITVEPDWLCTSDQICNCIRQWVFLCSTGWNRNAAALQLQFWEKTWRSLFKTTAMDHVHMHASVEEVVALWGGHQCCIRRSILLNLLEFVLSSCLLFRHRFFSEMM